MRLSCKKVLVTGADGFIGSHLVERLLNENCEVKAFVMYNSFNSWGWLDSLPSNLLKEVEVISGDVRDPFGVKKAVERVDCVFHLAALIAIPFSYHSPNSYVETNINGTLNVLEACRENKTEKLIITSTSEVYGTAKSVPIQETHFRQPQSPYSATKIAADCLAESFYRSFQLPVTVVRPFNTYGPRQSARAIIPTVITQLLSGKKQLNLGALHPTRDLVFVKDTAEGFVRIANSDKTIGEDVNIATASEISVGNVVNLISELLSVRIEILQESIRLRPANSEVERLIGCQEKLQKLTGWAPTTPLMDGLRATIEWFSQKENLAKYKSEIYNI